MLYATAPFFYRKVIMGNQIDVGALINAIVYLVPLLALMVSIMTFTNASKERHAKTASEAAELKAEIHLLTVQVEELKREYDEADNGFHSNATRITKLEEQAKTLWNKVSEIEKKVNRLD